MTIAPGPRGGTDAAPDDAALIRRAREGDGAPFGELVARHRSSALRVATVVLGGASDADDVVQVATERAWRAIGSVDAGRGFRSWYLRIVANTARNHRRGRGRRAALAVRVADDRGLAGEGAVDPAQAAVTDAERRRVTAALNRLGEGDRLVLALRHFEELSEREMAEILGCRPGTVKSRLSRATRRLRRELEADGTEEVSDG
ncbi:MAG: sigma-70 family RNA polymerase sigma factor [Actinomycetota bacterium]|nr:sigma-70 family RNA polymerase sigma factor [Actinomycetota bacterium]